MKKRYLLKVIQILLPVAFLLTTVRLQAAIVNEDSIIAAPVMPVPATAMSPAQERSFPGADALLNKYMSATTGNVFSEEWLEQKYTSGADSNVYRDQAKAEIMKVENTNRYVTALMPDDLNELPIGLSKTVGNMKVTIAISKAVFHADYAELTVFAKVNIPEAPNEIFFGMKGIKLSYKGGIIGDAKLVLLGDLPIRLGGGTSALILKGALDMATGNAQELTYVNMDCNGFKELGLAADLVFPRTMMVPLKANGEREEDPDVLVKAGFKTVVASWNDILVGVSLPAFEIAPLKGIGFQIGKAIFDASDVRNAPEIVYPTGYEARYMSADNPKLWRGVYVADLVVTLPSQFSKRNGDSRVSFGANNMIIDNNGITGLFFGNNILPDGSASGWKFTVDRMDIGLEANRLVSAGFQGAVYLPVSSDPIGYSAVITADNEYLLQLKTLNTFKFDLWQAKAQLAPNSWIQLKLADGKFQSEAMLTGSMGVTATGNSTDTSAGKAVANFKGIQFQNLHLQTQAPFFTAAYFGYKDEGKMSNFPVSINEIALTAIDKSATLYFGLQLNLMEKTITGGTRIGLQGKFEEKEGWQSWQFDKLVLSTIAIDTKISDAIKIKGTLNILRDDPIYGDGIAGSLNAGFMGDKIKVQARAMFGSKDYRYWFVDAKADFGAGITIIPPFTLQGFGGGAYYHMKKQGIDMLASPSGVTYVPDDNTALGVKAAILFAVPKKQTVNGEVSFEVAFNNSGGVNYMGFFGYAKFLGAIPGLENVSDAVGKQFGKLAELEKKAIDKLGGDAKLLEKLKVSDPSTAAANLMGETRDVGSGLSAYVGIQYDFTQSTFHSTFDFYVNAYGIIQGIGQNGRAGWGVLHIGPDSWYFHMGTPTDPMGIKFGVGSISVKTSSYLMFGDKIPGSPPPPQEVADILGMDIQELDYMRDLNALGEGKGFAFGARLSVETGDLTFLILYANFKAGVGFDIMLKDYGQETHCKGSNDPIGINGWYANGQSYVYLQGEVGVKVNLMFIKGRFPIISGAAAVLMQAKLPNPTWLRGYMALKFSILGGLVNGNMRMKITLGSECEIENGSSPVDVKIIGDVSPAKGSTNVDVFAAPTAAFNMKINKPFDVEDDNGVKTFRAKLDTFLVTDNGQAIPGKLQWNANEDGVSFYSKEVLPPKKTLKAKVSVTFEELVNGNWQVVYVNGAKSQETEERDFTTGTAPDYIPMQNIQYAYPVVTQQNYFPGESDKGYVLLKRGQSYLFDPRWKYKIQFHTDGAADNKLDMQYDIASQQLSYALPKLNTITTYAFDVVAIPPGGSDDGTTIAAYSSENNAEGGDYAVKSSKAQDVSRGDVTKSLLNYSFHASKYKTFAEKMGSIKVQSGVATLVAQESITLQASVNAYEVFDISELEGTMYTDSKPLVMVTAMQDNSYFQEDINPHMYANYPLFDNIYLSNRDTSIYGVPPMRAMPVNDQYLLDARQGEGISAWLKTRLPYEYHAEVLFKKDFVNLHYEVSNHYVEATDKAAYGSFLETIFPFIPYGKYNVKYQYVLPGGQSGTSGIVAYPNPLR